MGYLPSEAEQEQLLRDLAELIASRGSAQFLTAPILEPSTKFLPDAWTGDLAGAKTLLRRLMLYAGLDLDFDLQLYRARASKRRRHAIAWFLGIEGDLCLFGLDVEQLEDPQSLIAALCHEVAHAYRRRHSLEKADIDREEKLTDLTTVFLGFGLFNTNAADRFRQSAWVEGGTQYTERKLLRAGYLSVEQMTFLLAAQAVARGLPPRRVKALSRLLEVNQTEYLIRGVAHLTARKDEVLATLGLLPRAAGLVEALPADARSVYALRKGVSRYLLLAVLGLGAGLVLGTLLATIYELPFFFLLFSVGGAFAFPYFFGGPVPFVCGDKACRKRILAGSRICRGCGARISHWIESKKDLDELEQARIEE